jgi:hypothetical protein
VLLPVRAAAWDAPPSEPLRLGASSSNDPWQLTIEGPGGFTKSSDVDNEGVLYVDKLPATGKYVISIGPCADWGEPGTILIHASDPRLTIE